MKSDKKQEKTDYLLQSNKKVNDGKFDPIYSLYRPEISKLHALLNTSLGFVENYRKVPVGLQKIVTDNTFVAIKKSLFDSESDKKARAKEALMSAKKEKDEKAKRFNEYIENSKQIDKAINDILVSAGLKRLVKKADAQLTEEQLAEMAFSGMLATESGNESTEDVYEDLNVKNPTLRQKVIIAAVKGIRQVEGETRRFIRMNTLLSNRLYVENQEILNQMGE